MSHSNEVHTGYNFKLIQYGMQILGIAREKRISINSDFKKTSSHDCLRIWVIKFGSQQKAFDIKEYLNVTLFGIDLKSNNRRLK